MWLTLLTVIKYKSVDAGVCECEGRCARKKRKCVCLNESVSDYAYTATKESQECEVSSRVLQDRTIRMSKCR